MFLKKYSDIIAVENILVAWKGFLRGKRYKKDVLLFEAKLGESISSLHCDLKNRVYQHGLYLVFNISDPKPRIIHKATVRDRLLHHIIHCQLYPYFELQFIYDSYSCRDYKGVHRALNRFRSFAGKVSLSHTRTCFVLKCDIKKFFASIDQGVLMGILKRHIQDDEILFLVKKIVSSFYSTKPGIGNLTSQLLVNIYMHEFDIFVKQELQIKYYIRYADDFVILSEDRNYLSNVLGELKLFLEQKLHLYFHPDKVYIKTYASGVDFLGWVHFPHYRQIRTSTKKKVLRNTRYFPRPQKINSYRGLLLHGNTYRIKLATGVM